MKFCLRIYRLRIFLLTVLDVSRVRSRPLFQITSTFPVATDDSLSTSSSGRLQNHWFFCLRTLPPISLKARRGATFRTTGEPDSRDVGRVPTGSPPGPIRPSASSPPAEFPDRRH